MSDSNGDLADPRPSIELLESTHEFPGAYRIKVIGRSDDDFADRVVLEARAALASAEAVTYSLRPTPQGRHVAVTLVLTVESAKQVRLVYSRLMRLEGLVLLL
jgi:putative lipoic acid-binding regulatory protein